MIKSFRDNAAFAIYNQQYSKALPREIQSIALRKLIMIDNASNINDLRIPPGNHLEKLCGNRVGQYSIRINDAYRICFEFIGGNSYNVEITNYH